jgi:hypothetical protein
VVPEQSNGSQAVMTTDQTPPVVQVAVTCPSSAQRIHVQERFAHVPVHDAPSVGGS